MCNKKFWIFQARVDSKKNDNFKSLSAIEWKDHSSDNPIVRKRNVWSFLKAFIKVYLQWGIEP
jgi:hypothetical protein